MFVRVGSNAEIATGEMKVFEVAGTKVAVVSAEGSLYAFDDTCPHRGCSLASGRLEGTAVICTCHGSRFDVTTGAVLLGPSRQSVRSRPVQVQGDDVLVEE